jgi:uncharacterized protein DUF4262
MPPSKPPPAPTNPVHVRVAKDIAKYGWMVLAVAPTEDEPIDPFAYTVGLYRTYDVPELIVTGMNYENSHAVLGGVVERIERGQLFKARHYSKLLKGPERDYDAEFREVSRANREEMMKAANRWNAWEPYPALQLVWPDPKGVFPWEDGYDPRFIQPVLS